MINFQNNKSRRNVSEAGYSLLEMLVSIVIFLVVTGSIFGLMEITRIDRNRASRRSDTLKNARAAVHLIGRDALNAGLSYNLKGGSVPKNFLSSRLGIAGNVKNPRDLLTAIVAGNNNDTNSLLPAGGKTDRIAFAYRDMDFNKTKKYDGNGIEIKDTIGDTINVKSSQAGSSAKTAQITTAPWSTDADAAAPAINDLYLIETVDGSQVAVIATKVDSKNHRIEFAPGDPLGINQSLTGINENGSMLKTCTASVTTDCVSYPAALKRFNWISYKINSEGTLIRTVFGNNSGGTLPADQIQEQPLAYGIQNMQIRYVLEDGTVTDDPAAGPDKIFGTIDDTPESMNSVRQITVTLSVQASQDDEQTKTPETITVSATFSTRNLEYDAG